MYQHFKNSSLADQVNSFTYCYATAAKHVHILTFLSVHHREFCCRCQGLNVCL